MNEFLQGSKSTLCKKKSKKMKISDKENGADRLSFTVFFFGDTKLKLKPNLIKFHIVFDLELMNDERIQNREISSRF